MKYLTVKEGKNRTRIVVQVNTLVVFYVIGSALYTIFGFLRHPSLRIGFQPRQSNFYQRKRDKVRRILSTWTRVKELISLKFVLIMYKY